MSEIDTTSLQPLQNTCKELTEEQKLKNELVTAKRKFEEENFSAAQTPTISRKKIVEAEELKSKSQYDASEEGVAYNDYLASQTLQQQSKQMLEK